MNIGNVEIQIINGDIVQQDDIQAIVNAANAQLQIGGGVAGAIHRKGGEELAEETRPLAPIKTSQAVITGAPNLPNDHIIHVLGPIYGTDKPEDELLANCYRNALELADEKGIESIAFPAISTGSFGYPIEEAATVVFSTLKVVAPPLKNIKLVRLILFKEQEYNIYQEKLELLKQEI